ncbi:uncharacterized protein [Spinacia oleracea]|uniref:RNase H type-1 domain-containing protein n=1 Tax=Spinacia oleracea TaxID=3562 RepID=A0A9R0HYL8_SPIOL|nr:uncharacterized protein LOC110779175 [Spinacia oleracea]
MECQVCGAPDETIMRALFDCKHTQVIWESSEFADSLREAPISSFADMFVWVVGKLSKEKLRLFATLVWACWCYRNKAVFEEGEIEPVQVATGFARLVNVIKQYNERVAPHTNGSVVASACSWSPPPQGTVKINIDAHLYSTGVGVGVVIRDYRGVVLVAAVKRTDAAWSPNVAEASIALYGVALAKRLGYEKVMLECDAINIVRTIDKNEEGAPPIFLFFNDIRRVKSQFSFFKCVHVRRGGNTAAHLVARWEVNVSLERIYMGYFPQNLTTLTKLNLLSYILPAFSNEKKCNRASLTKIKILHYQSPISDSQSLKP